MKTNKLSNILAILCTAALAVSAHAGSIPGVAAQPTSYFYTGKPYDKDLGDYTFAARNYNPEINRWTSADPNGFPDGANQMRYGPTPTNALDYLGMLTISGVTTPNLRVTPATYNGHTYTVRANVATALAGTATLAATLQITDYSAYTDNSIGGAYININMLNVPTPTTGNEYHWIQTFVESDPIHGGSATNSGVDNGGAGNPFYDTLGAASASYFSDSPQAALSDADKMNNCLFTFTAELRYVSYNTTTFVTTDFGGIRWGYSIYE